MRNKVVATKLAYTPSLLRCITMSILSLIGLGVIALLVLGMVEWGSPNGGHKDTNAGEYLLVTLLITAFVVWVCVATIRLWSEKFRNARSASK